MLGELDCTSGTMSDTDFGPLTENLEQLMRVALAEFEAVEEKLEKGLTAEAKQRAQVAKAIDVVAGPAVHVETSDTSSELTAATKRRNRGRRRKWLAAQRAAVDALCADDPSTTGVVGPQTELTHCLLVIRSGADVSEAGQE